MAILLVIIQSVSDDLQLFSKLKQVLKKKKSDKNLSDIKGEPN